ncbi:cytidine deaminase [Shimia sp. R9_1]|uniref:cytidine deaminase n=1 Tax=unclassified Shimia TaxID=2630038 RepID=UPI001ADBC572|nr:MULTISPECIES: cytidine deaminase [unclassified Shimia]MBO9396654.1 cytidine deaminase [Shimia sp. R9_2]MBO9400173.1 cytidine deaminase [Shimia sp. R9_3]MBO9406515.1 cytidine deaminase [Shimia sp. R9_1]
MSQDKSLETLAFEVRENAYAPYSNFKVGAAILSEGGVKYAGCNVENIAYPEGTCAEAGAIAAMVAAGETRLTEVFVVADSKQPVSPCGGCRQKLAEFGGKDTKVTLANLEGVRVSMTMAELLPGAFGTDHMDADHKDRD